MARNTKPNATMTFRRGPSDKGRNAKKWREAGFAPADHIFIDFPAELVPDMAYLATTFRRPGGRALMLTMGPDDLTDDVLTGAGLVDSDPGRHGSVITRDEATARFEKWQAKPRLRAL